MSPQPWAAERYASSGREGAAHVPGAVLKYRLAGPADARDVVVFESGWSAPFPYSVWIEEALAPHVRVLSYDRAGVGDSVSESPPTAAGMTRQLTALLSSRGIDQPVVVAGHSYGGLVAALHAAQAPDRVRAIVQIDPTPEFDDALVDAANRALPLTARILQLCALLRIDGPIFLDLQKTLPPQVFARVKREPRWLMRSLSGSLAEIRLLEQLRQLIRASPAAQQCPRLVISGTYEKPATRLQKLLVSDEKAARYWHAVHELHRRQGALNAASRWMSLPYNHVGLVTHEANAREVASHILDFIR